MHGKTYIRLMNSREWRNLRNSYLQAHPLCEGCQDRGYVTAARCVHHKVPVESGRSDRECEELAFRWSNLQALCFQCHADIHKAERSHSREAHRARAAARLEAWKERHRGGGQPCEGGSTKRLNDQFSKRLN